VQDTAEATALPPATGVLNRRALIATAVLAFSQDAIYGFIYLSYMNHYLLGRLHSAGGLPGYTLALYGGTQLLVQPFAGRVLDRTSPRLLFRLSVAAQGVGVALLLTLSSLPAFLAASVFMAIGSAAMWPLIYDTIARTQARGVRSEVTGILSLTGYLATGTGFAGGVLLAHLAHWRLAFVAVAVVVFAPLVLQPMHAFDPGEQHSEREHGPRSPVFQQLQRVAFFGLIVFVDYAAITSLAAVYGPFARLTLGLSLPRTTFLLAPAGAAALVMLMLSARLSRPGRRFAEMAVLYVMSAVGAFALALATNQWVAMAVAPVLAAGAGGIGPIIAATMIDQGGEGDRGTVIGTLMSIEGVGGVVGPALSALVIDLASPRWGIAFIGCLFAALASLSLAAHWRNRRLAI
jgi:MFS family permease